MWVTRVGEWWNNGIAEWRTDEIKEYFETRNDSGMTECRKNEILLSRKDKCVNLKSNFFVS